MKFHPQTLLGRTALYLGILMLVAQAIWFGGAGLFLGGRMMENNQRRLAVTIVLARRLLAAEPKLPEQRFGDLLLRHDATGVAFDPPDHRNFALERWLGDQTGAPVLVRHERGNPRVWMRIQAGPREEWMVEPVGSPALPYWLLAWVGIVLALSVACSYLIIFRLTRQLRQLTRATRAIGHAEAPAPLEERGPLEIRELTRGFNQMAADLLRLDADRRLMLAGISHDFRTPLTRLRIALELAPNGNEPEIWSGMERDLEEIDAILKQFLDYARDGGEEEPAQGDLNTIVTDVCRRYIDLGSAIDVRVGALRPFLFRRLALRRVITNLVDNAVRHGGKEIQVLTETAGALALVTVLDNGPGIRRGHPADFIQPFARESSSRSKAGAGLGLAIADRVVRGHAGRLRVENRPGGGFLARIEIPVSG